MSNVHVLKRYAEAGEAGLNVDLAEALAHPWNIDAHFTQYDDYCRRSKAAIVGQPMIMVCAAFDYDCPNHEPSANHFAEISTLLERLPDGACAYFTANGFRVVTLLRSQVVVDSQEAWERWRAYHAGLRLQLDVILNEGVGHSEAWYADPSCDDPSRLFRLPDVKRKRAPCYPELLGTLGYLSWDPIHVEPHAAVECHDGAAAHTIVGGRATLVGAVLRDEGSKLIVECPWADNHTTGGEDAVVFSTADGMGKFHCSHNGCSDKNSNEALRAWGYDFGDQEDSAPSPKAPMGAAPSDGSTPQSSASCTQTGGSDPFIRGDELAAPLPEVVWLCKDLELGYGRPPLLTSDPGAGKTWATQAMALAVASGQKLFGAFDVTQAPVLHVSLDSGVRATKRRYQRLAAGMGLDLTKLDLSVYAMPMRVVDKFGAFQPKAFEVLNNEVIRRGVRLVILDSLAAICGGLDENSTEIAEPLFTTKDDECVWLWTHHNNRQGTVRGSSALAAAAGVWWAISKDEETGDRVWTRQKASEDHEDDDDDQVTKFHTRWELDPDGWGARILVQRDRRLREEGAKPATLRTMRETVERNPGLTQSQIFEACAAVPMREADRRACLGYLVSSGALRSERCKKSWLYFPGDASRNSPPGSPE